MAAGRRRRPRGAPRSTAPREAAPSRPLRPPVHARWPLLSPGRAGHGGPICHSTFLALIDDQLRLRASLARFMLPRIEALLASRLQPPEQHEPKLSLAGQRRSNHLTCRCPKQRFVVQRSSRCPRRAARPEQGAAAGTTAPHACAGNSQKRAMAGAAPVRPPRVAPAGSASFWRGERGHVARRYPVRRRSRSPT